MMKLLMMVLPPYFSLSICPAERKVSFKLSRSLLIRRSIAILAAEEIFGGALVVPLQTENFPRALWAPQAPLALILTIGFIICVVWGTYIYVVVQLVRIRKGGIG